MRTTIKRFHAAGLTAAAIAVGSGEQVGAFAVAVARVAVIAQPEPFRGPREPRDNEVVAPEPASEFVRGFVGGGEEGLRLLAAEPV